MANLEFEFNQAQLSKLITKTPAANDLHVSIFSINEGGEPHGEIYLAAQSMDTPDVPNKMFDPVIACPVPPGWSPGAAFVKVIHEDLAKCPKFIVKAADKITLLNNQFPAGNEHLRVILEGTNAGGTGGTDLVIKASFKIKKLDGTSLPPNVDAEVK